jgi:hypothetical protein
LLVDDRGAELAGRRLELTSRELAILRVLATSQQSLTAGQIRRRDDRAFPKATDKDVYDSAFSLRRKLGTNEQGLPRLAAQPAAEPMGRAFILSESRRVHFGHLTLWSGAVLHGPTRHIEVGTRVGTVLERVLSAPSRFYPAATLHNELGTADNAELNNVVQSARIAIRKVGGDAGTVIQGTTVGPAWRAQRTGELRYLAGRTYDVAQGEVRYGAHRGHVPADLVPLFEFLTDRASETDLVSRAEIQQRFGQGSGALVDG